jgi:pseudaminic acid cytidylyltransferase
MIIDKTKNIAIIPARGGSKRIPKKNIKSFFGKPMIAYPIEIAIQSDLFNQVIVSTDSEEIAEIAVKYGATVPFKRSPELSDDYAGTDEVFVHSLEWLRANDQDYQYACCIYPTTPLLKTQYLQEGYRLVQDDSIASVISVAAYSSRIQRAFKNNKSDRLEMIYPEHRRTRSNDLAESYFDAGQFYWVDTNKYLVEKEIYSKDSVAVVIPFYLVTDIDSPEDWIIAEKLYQIDHL